VVENSEKDCLNDGDANVGSGADANNKNRPKVAQVALLGETYTLEELLPNRREFGFLVLLLAGIYLFTGFFLRPEAYPSIVGHLIIWALYALLTHLFWLALRRSKRCDFHSLETQPPQWLWVVGVLTYTVVAMLAESLFLPVDELIVLIGWYGSALLGLIAILHFAWLLIAKKVTLRG